MAASYDGDGNRVFQISRSKAVTTVLKSDTSNAEKNPEASNSGIADPETPGSFENNPSGIEDVPSSNQTEVHTYYEKIYVDPADSIFWYGFGQGLMNFFGNINSALSSYLSNWFCTAWDYVTGQYELVLHSEEETESVTYSEADIEAMKKAGLTEEDILAVTCGVAYTESAEICTDGTLTSETVVIPENGENDTETVNASYELTYYVNNVNTENTQVLMEYGKRDELKSVYTYGLNRISVETIADIYNPALDEFETDYYLYDGRGSVANVLTDSSEIVASYSYDPFGNITKGAPAFDCFYGYNAEETNPVTGLQYLRARYYDTETGRFGTADTYLGVVTDPLTLNRYAYTVNNPVMQIDPSGHWPKLLDKAANKVKSAVSTVATGVKNTVNTVATGVKKAVNTVKTEVKKVADTVNENVIKPVVKTVKSAAQWTNDNIIKPATTFVKETVIEPISKVKDTAVEKITKVAETVYEGYQDIKQAAVASFKESKAYVSKQFNIARQKVKKFACGTAEKLSNEWGNFKQDSQGYLNNVSSIVVDNIGQLISTDEFLWVVDKAIVISEPAIDFGKFLTKYDLLGAEEVIGLALGTESENGVYHIKQDYWQSWGPIGYNDGYDDVFRVAINATGNTMDHIKSAEFTVDGKTYMFWAWKGDYMNLGAGAETGIYEKYSDTHWLTATDKATTMELTLTQKDLYSYKPTEGQWWITGFDSKTQNVQAENLTSTTVIDFKSMDNGIEMFNAFKSATLDDLIKRRNWKFTDDYKAILTW